MPLAHATAVRQPCFAVRFCAELKRLIVLAIGLGLVLVAGKYYCFDRLNEEIRSRVEQVLRDHYKGLAISVKSARRIAGQGIEIRGVRIAEAGRGAPTIADIDEVFATCDTRLPDFLTKPPQITALRLHRLKLRAERKPSGRWNLAHLLPLPPCQSGLAPAAVITDGSLEILDPTQAGAGAAGGLMLRNIELTVAPNAAASPTSSSSAGILLAVRGSLAGDHVERVEIEGTLDPLTSRWEVRGAVQGLEFSPRMRAALPNELGQLLAPLSSIRGRTFFGFHASRAAREATPLTASAITGSLSSQITSSGAEAPLPGVQFAIHGRIAEGRIDDSRLPEPLTDVEATLHCDNRGITIDELSARCGPTQIELNASTVGYDANQTIDMRIAARQLQLERLPIHTLSPAIAKTWQQFQPRGLADVAGRLQFDGHQWTPDLAIRCRDLSLSYEQFAYRLTDGAGDIIVRRDSIAVQVAALAGGQRVHCRGDIRHPGPNFVGWINLQSEGPVAIDDKLIAAMEPATQRIVRSFRPRGGATFAARLGRDDSQSPLQKTVRVELCECSIQQERFSYPIDHVNGVLALTDGTWRFEKLTGRNDSAEIACDGFWRGGSEAVQRLELKFTARDVPLADELRRALPQSSQRLWTNLCPRGNIDQIWIDLAYSPAAQRSPDGPWTLELRAEKLPLAASGEGRAVSLEPVWFPYTLNHVTGSLRYRNGRLDLANIKAVHGHASIAGEGHCTILPAGGCQVELTRVCADRMQVDADLLSALPGGLGESLGRAPLEGPVGIEGAITILVPPQPELPPQLTWNLSLDVENGRLLTATPVEHIHGGIRLTGRHTAEGLWARGDFLLDSLMVHGIQVTAIQGPFWLDGRRLVFGALADREAVNRAPRQVTARALTGLISADGELSLTGDSRFDVEASLANADLATLASQFAPHHRDLSGKLFGSVHMLGDTTARHTWQGDGKVHLRDADLYELPAMITLLKLLSIQRPSNTAFTNSNIDFRIEGDDLAFDRIDFSGDAISLKGRGRMTAQRQIDLKFYPIPGRAERQLPAIFPILRETGREFMLIEVTGTVDQPFVHRQVFPRLDAQLAQLFPELARDGAVEANAPAVTPARSAIRGILPERWR